jgi:hypothetical protein
MAGFAPGWSGGTWHGEPKSHCVCSVFAGGHGDFSWLENARALLSSTPPTLLETSTMTDITSWAVAALQLQAGGLSEMTLLWMQRRSPAILARLVQCHPRKLFGLQPCQSKRFFDLAVQTLRTD